MASQKTKFTVGLFLAGGITIALLSIIWLGMSRFFEKGHYYATYFNESVQGLDKDSPVKFRGVPIGRVDRIAVAPDSKLIQVVLKVETGQALDTGIVAQLKAVGITGAMFVDIDQKKAGEPDRTPPLTFPSEYPIVASKPSDISQLLQGIDEVLNNMKKLDFEGISKSIQTSLDGVAKILNSEKWGNIMTSVEAASLSLSTLMDRGNQILMKAEKTLTDVQGIVTDKQQAIRAALDDFRSAMGNANILMERSSSLIQGTDDSISYLKKNLLAAGQNLERASDNLNRLLETLSEQPSQFLFGEAPLPRETEESNTSK